MVLVHGLGLSGRYFVPLARRLAAGGATVLVPDLPGNARSRAAARRAPDVAQCADALARLLQRLFPGPSVLVANSVGCQVAASLAARHPHLVSRLVLVGPALEPGASGWRQFARLVADAPKELLGLLGLAAFDYLVADGRATDLPGTAHAAHYGAPDAMAALIEKFTVGGVG